MLTENIVGKKFGLLTVLNKVEKPEHIKSKGSYYLCRCDCGSEKIISGSILKSGRTKSCGCSHIKHKDLIGKKFGRLIVIEKKYYPEKRNKLFWQCSCDCGKIIEVSGSQLILGKSKSCGCLSSELKSKRILEKNFNWKGGKIIDDRGYVQLKMHNHPNKNKNGYVKEHVYIMTQYIGRSLYKNETVHHKNGIKTDNRIENLDLRIKAHGAGQSVEEMIVYYMQILFKYKPEFLKGNL